MGDQQAGLSLLALGEKRNERNRLRDQEANAMRVFQGLSGDGEAPSGGSARQAGGASTEGGPRASLINNESGGRWDAQNNVVGAGGHRGHFGRLQFGQARLQEAMAAGAIPPGTTPQQFMANPELQKAAERWHFADIDENIRRNGFDRMIGQTINGVPIDMDRLRAVAHLGGNEGMRRFVETGGRYNPADANGTRLSDYFTRHGGGRQQVARNEADVQALEAQMAGQQPRGHVQTAGRVQAIQGDDPVRLRQEAQAYEATNPEAARQMRERADMAERAGGAQMAQANAPAPGAAPAQFATPGQPQARQGLPPGDPFPRASTQQLMQAMSLPGITDGQRQLLRGALENRQRYMAEGGQLREENQRLQNQKLQRDLDNRFEPLTTPEQRRAVGIPGNDARPYQINRSTGEIKAVGGSQVTINQRNEGAIPVGYRAIRDAQGNVERMEPIPGSKAEQEVLEAQEKRAKAQTMRGETGNIVGNALNDIDTLMSSAWFSTTGAIGSRLANIPGTAAHDISQALNTIGANISFEKLQKMREASPTGGALGAVTEKELDLLRNSYSSLAQSQSEQQFKSNLGRVRAIFERTVHNRVLTPTERRIGGPLTPERVEAIREEARQAIAGGAPRAEVLKRLGRDFGISPEGL
jgi:hypothetical protein